LVEVLGLAPERILKLWKCRDSVIDKNGKLIPERVNNPCSDSLSTQIVSQKPQNMTNAEAVKFEDFMRKIFRYEPEERLSAAELLHHPWLN
jgi:serine/threonine protein kinase